MSVSALQRREVLLATTTLEALHCSLSGQWSRTYCQVTTILLDQEVVKVCLILLLPFRRHGCLLLAQVFWLDAWLTLASIVGSMHSGKIDQHESKVSTTGLLLLRAETWSMDWEMMMVNKDLVSSCW